MDQLELIVPGMWADHHVLRVRDLLQSQDGIERTVASALETSVRVEYDAQKTDPERITALLAEAGYEPGPRPEPDAVPTSKPAWATGGMRATVTDPGDLAMSGDYRKY